MYQNEDNSFKKHNLKIKLKRMLRPQKQFAVGSLLDRKLDDPFDDKKIESWE